LIVESARKAHFVPPDPVVFIWHVMCNAEMRHRDPVCARCENRIQPTRWTSGKSN